MVLINKIKVNKFVALKPDVFDKDYIIDMLEFKSYTEYLLKGGTRTKEDLYSKIKEHAKSHELAYIQAVDMVLSGIPISEDKLDREWILATASYYALTLICEVPLRKVCYTIFNLEDFNRF